MLVASRRPTDSSPAMTVGLVLAAWCEESDHRDCYRLGDNVAEVGVSKAFGIGGVAEVTKLDAHGRHAGQSKQVPGLSMGTAVDEVRPAHDFVLDEFGKASAHHGFIVRVTEVVRGDPSRDAGWFGVGVERNDQVSAGAICECGPRCLVDRLGHVVGAGPRDENLGTDRCEAAFNPTTQVVGDDRLSQPVRDVAVVVAAVAGVDDHNFVRHSGARHRMVVFGSQCGSGATLDRAGESVERTPDLRPTRAVNFEADVALELAQRLIRIRTENPVYPPGVEPQGVELPLQVSDVITCGHVAERVRDDPVAEVPPSFLKLAERRRANDAIDHDAAILLELPDRDIELGAEKRMVNFAAAHAEKPEPL